MFISTDRLGGDPWDKRGKAPNNDWTGWPRDRFRERARITELSVPKLSIERRSKIKIKMVSEEDTATGEKRVGDAALMKRQGEL